MMFSSAAPIAEQFVLPSIPDARNRPGVAAMRAELKIGNSARAELRIGNRARKIAAAFADLGRLAVGAGAVNGAKEVGAPVHARLRISLRTARCAAARVDQASAAKPAGLANRNEPLARFDSKMVAEIGKTPETSR